MELKIANSVNDLARQANLWIEEQANAGVSNFFLPAGGTPLALYRLWREEKPAYLDRLTFTQIDEVATGAKKGAFEAFFRKELPERVGQMRWVRECPEPAQAAVLGFGTNGHIAFHEPGLDVRFGFGSVKLSSETVKKLGLENQAWGTTFGLETFAHCKSLLLLISGAQKDQAYADFLRSDPKVPAAQLKNHPHLTVVVDRSTVNSAGDIL